MEAGICNSVGGGVFLTCHCGANAGVGSEYWSVSKLRLLIDIRIATSHWPFLLCCKLGDVVHLSRCDVLPGLYRHAVCTLPCRSICPVSFPSRLITTHISTTAAVANKLNAMHLKPGVDDRSNAQLVVSEHWTVPAAANSL